jgi:hypothetical protein
MTHWNVRKERFKLSSSLTMSGQKTTMEEPGELSLGIGRRRRNRRRKEEEAEGEEERKGDDAIKHLSPSLLLSLWLFPLSLRFARCDSVRFSTLS